MAVIHRVGLPESEAERQTIRLLKERLPDEYIVFHNLETVSPAGFAYEVDLLVIAPHAVYVIEEKNYSGHIRGNIREWQMFNGAVFPSPIPAVNRKARVEGHLDERYTAPEALASPANASAQSDLYSVGIMLYEAICGTTSYTNPQDLLQHGDFTWEIPPHLVSEPARINETIYRLCAFSPARRLSGAAEAGARLAELGVSSGT